ncbi:Peptidase S28 [Corchorus olitorius]|uniref:Peptidase S28 n=1 Tax=Corchorus olitorius TaxID=93759 RepID=A0A1R3J649_9ROSI|nr:Peptidase S28 [Corchorus olitorius]
MISPKFSSQWLQFILVLIFSTSLSFAGRTDVPRLSPIGVKILEDGPETASSAPLSEDLETYYYNQTLDHFNYQPESYATFQQRYVMNSKHWGGANSSAPIFAYLGAEAPLDGDLKVIGFLNDNAARFNALLLYIEEASETCYQTIRQSWSEIDEIASHPNGLSTLSTIFQTCKPLNSAKALKDYLVNMYAGAAQYDRPPTYPVTVVCGGIDGSKKKDILSKISAGVFAYRANRSCYINQPTNQTETDVGWPWQTCSEMVIPIGIGNRTMFQPDPFDLAKFSKDCKDFYGVPPRPHWVTSYYGGHDLIA